MRVSVAADGHGLVEVLLFPRAADWVSVLHDEVDFVGAAAFVGAEHDRVRRARGQCGQRGARLVRGSVRVAQKLHVRTACTVTKSEQVNQATVKARARAGAIKEPTAVELLLELELVLDQQFVGRLEDRRERNGRLKRRGHAVVLHVLRQLQSEILLELARCGEGGHHLDRLIEVLLRLGLDPTAGLEDVAALEGLFKQDLTLDLAQDD